MFWDIVANLKLLPELYHVKDGMGDGISALKLLGMARKPPNEWPVSGLGTATDELNSI